METHSTEDSEQPAGALTTTQPRTNQIARRDFAGTSLAVGNSATDALVAKARADTEARWIMAMRQPRNLDNARQEILRECRRPGFADVAIYSVPRGDKAIEGLSIRFAEVAVRCMTNMQPEVQTIYDSDHERIVRVTVTDYETNVTWSKDLTVKKTVERKFLKKGQRPISERTNSYGDRVYIVEATDDDVATKEAAQVSKAVRTLILRMIPGHIQDEAFAVCRQVARDREAKDPDHARIRMLDSFANLGVMPGEIELLIGHTTERLQPAELERLRKLFAGISEGEITWQDALAESQARASKPATAAAASAPDAAKAPQTAAPQATAQTKPKGAAALKAQLKPEPKTTVEPAPDIKPAPSTNLRPGEVEGEAVIMPCAGCGGPIEAPAELRGKAQCDACANS